MQPEGEWLEPARFNDGVIIREADDPGVTVLMSY
jgi:hypothetical protein